MGQFVIAAVIFTVLVVIQMVKPKAAFTLTAVAVIIGGLAVLVGIFTLLAGGTAGVQNYMSYLNSIGANTTYTQVASSYSGPTFDFGATIMLFPFFGMFVYPWVNAGPAVASEIKGKGALRYNVAISSTLTLIAITVSFATMYYVGGFNFINGALGNATLVYNWSFGFWTLAMGVSSNVAAQWFMGIGWVLWYVGGLNQIIIVLTRYLFAQSFDRFLPEKISYVSPKYGSPTVALLVALVGALIFIALDSFFYGTFVALYGVVIASMIYFLFIGLAATAYAFKNEKGRTKGVLATCGLLMAIVFAYVSYQFVAYPSIWGGTTLAYGWVVASFIAGIVIYTISKSYYGKRGIDITLAYKEIPPL